MSTPAVLRSARARAVRAAGLAPVCVLLPVGGHVLAGGGAPSAGLLLRLTALLWLVLLLRPPRSTGPRGVLALASAASAGQVVVHSAATAAHEHPVTGVDGRMLLGHLTATALTLAVLVRGEAALAATAELLARALRVVRPGAVRPAVPSAVVAQPVADSDRVRVGRVLAAAAPRRGPPVPSRSVPCPA